MVSDSINPLRRSKAAELKRMSAFTGMAQGVFKMKKKRKKEVKPREQPEAKFRGVLIKYLRKHGCRVTRVEPSFKGDFSLGDLWVLCEHTGWGGFVEVKSLTGQLSEGQKVFRDSCYKCGVNYIVARVLDDVGVVIK